MSKERPYSLQAVKWFKKNGYVYDKAEHVITPTTKRDLFGFMDYVALRPDVGIVGVQVTSVSNHADRRNKILSSLMHRVWLMCGGKILILSFKRGKTGRYTERTEWIE